MRKIGGYIRKSKHKRYVEEMVIVMRDRVCKQAVMYGSSDVNTRKLYLKYNEYLNKLNKELN